MSAQKFWEVFYNWTFAMTLADAYPLSYGILRVHDPDCDIVQSAAAGQQIATSACIIDTPWRHRPRTPEGNPVRAGMHVVPRHDRMVIIRPALGSPRGFTDISVRPQSITAVARLIAPNKRWYGQYAVIFPIGNFLPIDHGMFSYT